MSYLKKRPKDFVITFVDFRKASDSINREALIQILREFSLDNKTTNLIKKILTNTHSKVKFRGATSDNLKLKQESDKEMDSRHCFSTLFSRKS